MKYHDLVGLLEGEAVFDLASVGLLSGEKRETLRVQLSRWCKTGKLLPLRRGMYAFPQRIRKTEVNPAELANKLYQPSYLSRQWALGFYGLIPEKVVTYTSVTTRVPRVFENAFGIFKYQSIKQSAFFGYMAVDLDGKQVLLAAPEKALLDFWHYEKGDWDNHRMKEMRFQNASHVDPAKLKSFAERFSSPRLLKAVSLWLDEMAMEEKGSVEL